MTPQPNPTRRRREKRRRANAPWIAHLRREGACCRCGTRGTETPLQAHHTDPSRRRLRVTWNRSRRALRAALKACCWLCEPCHVAVHQGLVPVDHPDFRPIVGAAA